MNTYNYILLFLILLIYFVVILWLTSGLKKLPKTSIKAKYNNKFSIIIPFRNEASKLSELLESLNQIAYPKQQFVIYMVDDESTDDSRAIIEAFILKNKDIQLRIITNIRKTNSPKKDAINTAIAVCKTDWVISTDADCIVSPKILQAYDTYISHNDVAFIAGPVSYVEKKGFLHQFQEYDWMSLMGTGIGGFGQKHPMLCSGANLAYRLEAFQKVKGFQGNEHIASGDDVFLLNKMQRHFPNKVAFLNTKEATVKTFGVNSWSELIQQRIRWSRKSGNIPNNLLKFIGIIVALVNLALIYVLVQGLFLNTFFVLYLISFVSKFAIDSVFMIHLKEYFKHKFSFFTWILSSLLYPFFIISIGVIGIFSGYNWKGRYFQK